MPTAQRYAAETTHPGLIDIFDPELSLATIDEGGRARSLAAVLDDFEIPSVSQALADVDLIDFRSKSIVTEADLFDDDDEEEDDEDEFDEEDFDDEDFGDEDDDDEEAEEDDDLDGLDDLDDDGGDDDESLSECDDLDED